MKMFIILLLCFAAINCESPPSNKVKRGILHHYPHHAGGAVQVANNNGHFDIPSGSLLPLEGEQQHIHSSGGVNAISSAQAVSGFPGASGSVSILANGPSSFGAHSGPFLPLLGSSGVPSSVGNPAISGTAFVPSPQVVSTVPGNSVVASLSPVSSFPGALIGTPAAISGGGLVDPGAFPSSVTGPVASSAPTGTLGGPDLHANVAHYHLGHAVQRHVTVLHRIGIPVPQPYNVPVERRIPVQVPTPVDVPVDRPYPVRVARPYEVRVYKDIPVQVDQPIPVPVSVPVHINVPHHVRVEQHVPVPVHIYKKIPVPVPHPIIVKEKVPVSIHAHIEPVHHGHFHHQVKKDWTGWD